LLSRPRIDEHTATRSGASLDSPASLLTCQSSEKLLVNSGGVVTMSQSLTGLMNLPACLEDVKIKSLTNSAYYIADFISEAEESAILNKVRAVIYVHVF
jgi:hypothetical protein